MNKSEVLQRLRDHEAELKAAGIAHVSLFGSVARDEASASSDVDLMVEFDSTMRRTLVTMGRLESDLSDLLGAHVDLTPSNSMRPYVSRRVRSEAVLAF